MRFASSLTIITLSHEHGDRTKWNSSHLVAYLIRPSFFFSFPRNLSLFLFNTMYINTYLRNRKSLSSLSARIIQDFSKDISIPSIEEKIGEQVQRFEHVSRRFIINGSNILDEIGGRWTMLTFSEYRWASNRWKTVKRFEWKIRGQLERRWKIVGLVGALLATACV